MPKLVTLNIKPETKDRITSFRDGKLVRTEEDCANHICDLAEAYESVMTDFKVNHVRWYNRYRLKNLDAR